MLHFIYDTLIAANMSFSAFVVVLLAAVDKTAAYTGECNTYYGRYEGCRAGYEVTTYYGGFDTPSDCARMAAIMYFSSTSVIEV